MLLSRFFSFFLLHTIIRMNVTAYNFNIRITQHAFKIDSAVSFKTLQNIFESLFSRNMADFLYLLPKDMQTTCCPV